MNSKLSQELLPEQARSDLFLVPMSFAQERLWFLEQLTPDRAIYNIPLAMRWSGRLDIAALQAALSEVVRRHEVFRTTYSLFNGEPVQFIAESQDFSLELEELEGCSDQEVQQIAEDEAARSFNLNAGPVFRARLLRLGPEEHAVFFTMHHIAGDGWSTGVLVREVALLYEAFVRGEGTPLQELPIQYADYAVWQREWFEGEISKGQLAYWKEQLASLSVWELPADKPRPEVQSFNGATELFPLPKQMNLALKKFSQQEGVTFFMSFLTALQFLLCRITGQEDIAIGTVVANRNRKEIERLIGFFANTLVLRTELSGNPTFRDALRRVRNVTLGAFAHEDMPFNKLVEALGIERDERRSPLFQVALVLENAPIPQIELSGLRTTPLKPENRTAKFDLCAFVMDTPGQFALALEYSTDLFHAATIRKMGRQFIETLDEMMAVPERRILDYTVLKDEIAAALNFSPGTLEKVLPLTPAQRDFFLDYSNHPRDITNNFAVSMQLGASINPSVWEKAVWKIMDCEEVSRTKFFQHGNEFLQLIGTRVAAEFLFAAWTAGGNESCQLDEFIQEKRQMEFDLQRSSLLRNFLVENGRDNYVAVLVMPRLLLDVHSARLLLEKTRDAFLELTGGPTKARAIGKPFADYAEESRVHFDTAAARSYWISRFRDTSPLRFYASPMPGCAISRQIEIAGDQFAGLKKYCNARSCSPGKLVRALFGFLVHVYFESARNFVMYEVLDDRCIAFAGTLGCYSRLSPMVFCREWFGPEAVLPELMEFVDENSGKHGMDRKISKGLMSKFLPEESIRFVYSCSSFSQSSSCDAPGAFAVHASFPEDEVHLAVCESGGRMELKLHYHSGHFDDLAFLDRISAMVRQIGRGEDRFYQLDTLLTEERLQLREWNSTEKDYPKHNSILDLIEQQVEKNGERQALVFEGRQFSYRELNQRANQLGHYLRKLGVGPEVRVGICMERGVEMVVGILGILKAGGAYVPLDPDYPEERLRYMVEDAQVALLLLDQLSKPKTGAAKGVKVVSLKEDWNEISRENSTNVNSGVRSNNLAYVIYTSGSTGRPKGVMNVHSGLLNRLQWMQESFTLGEKDRVLQKTPFGFDVSVWEFFWPFMYGACLVVARPQGHRDGRYLLDVIAKEKITTLHFVPSMLQVFLNEPGVENTAGLKWVICSGEALTEKLVRDFQRKMSAQLWNLYGPTEAAIDVSYWDCRRLSASGVRIGQPIANIQLHVLNRLQEPVPEGVSGELYIGGAGLARGYWRKAELTAERFVPDPFSRVGGERLYRTGDQARLGRDGMLEYQGRIDQQVKIRGFRIELGEIEAVLHQYAGVDEAAVVVQEDEGGEKRLVAYVAGNAGGEVEMGRLREYVQEKLPEYMVLAGWVELGKMPLTANGKLDRKGLPRWEAGGERNRYEGPRTVVEEMLAGIWGEILQVERIGIDENFFEMGGHSLLATRVISRIREMMGIEVPLRAVFEKPTIAGLAEQVERARGKEQEVLPMVAVDRSGELLLSFAQQRLWFLYQLLPGNAFYNVADGMRLKGQLDEEALQESLNGIVRRHEVLRTRFSALEGKARQEIMAACAVKLEKVDLRGLKGVEQETELRRLAEEEARRPFDLGEVPLLRAKLLRVEEAEHVLLLGLHHIASDGWSVGVAVREIGELYGARLRGEEAKLGPLKVQYADYAQWERDWLRGEVLEEKLGYWRKQLAGAPARLELPTDRARPAVSSYKGASLPWRLPMELTRQLRAMMRREGVTLYMALLTGFQILLARYSGQKDIVVGSPIANRNRAEIEGLIGFFVNMLVLRTELDGNPSVGELLRRVREVCLEAYAHQSLPFEKLVEELEPERDLGRQPMFQAMFALQSAPRGRLEMEGLELERFAVELGITRFDLECHFAESGEQVSGRFFYSLELFEEGTIEQMMRHYGHILEEMVRDSGQKVWELPLLEAAERKRLLARAQRVQRDYGRRESIVELFEEQVEKNGERQALVFESRQFSYRELNQRANQLGHYLRKLGVGPEVRVGICMERGVEMVVGILGILKAGGAYVPLDPDYPEERLRYMVEDAEVLVLLAGKESRVKLGGSGRAVTVCVEEEMEQIGQQSRENVGGRSVSGNLAYMIYTSGSTGRPKGSLITHGNVTRLMEATDHWFHFQKEDVWTLFHSYAFDFSVWELWGPLLYGGSLVIVSYWTSRSPEQFHELLCEQKVTVLNQTPSAFRQLMAVDGQREKRLSLRYVIFGGEALEVHSLKSWWERHGEDAPQLINMYGITETTVHVTYYELGVKDLERTGGSPIGVSIPDLQAYVLDGLQEPVPEGVSGELYIGGAGLARGYWRKAELTAERFVPDPFSRVGGERLYRTGDQARLGRDGMLEYQGRIDQQVKIRGFRIELGEIEAVLHQYAGVDEAAVVVQEDEGGEKRLVAYVVPRKGSEESDSQGKELQGEQVSEWRLVFDSAYRGGEPEDPTFNIRGWNSSYTGQPIPSEEMREWLEGTIDGISRLRPTRVLEIGSGTGMLLFRIAPQCSRYIATDFSAEAVEYVERQLKRMPQPLQQVSLWQRPADNFAGMDAEEIDTVVLNSVAQYFPDIDYLVQVLKSASRIIKAGGWIFIGDLRHLGLLEAFYTGVEMQRAQATLKLEQLRQRIRERRAKEDELVISPSFFLELQQEIPEITRVEVRPKRGSSNNELTQFRYDVCLQIRGEAAETEIAEFIDWPIDDGGLEKLREVLQTDGAASYGIRGVPNARVADHLRAVEFLKTAENNQHLVHLQEWLADQEKQGVGPDEMWRFGRELGFETEISWAESNEEGSFDVFLRRANGKSTSPQWWPAASRGRASNGKNLNHYVTNPTRVKLAKNYIPRLRSYLQEKLPDYMVPSAFVMLEKMPLTPNGKLDRKSLPAPEGIRPELQDAFVAPRNDVERKIAALWQDLLRMDKVGVNDNFFDLGGNSLLAIQFLSKLRDAFRRDIRAVEVFQFPTVGSMAQNLGQNEEVFDALESVQAKSAKQKLALAHMKPMSKAYGNPEL